MYRSIALGSLLLAVASATGCASNLVVSKVALADREAGRDHQDGFRYYLPRPYIAVQDKVLVSERRSLVILNPTTEAVCFLDGDRKGQQVKLADLRVTDAGGAARPMTPDEIARLRGILKEPGGVQPVAFAQDGTGGLQPNVDSLAVPAKENITAGTAVTLDGKIQVLFLPDLDEQYAIKSRNILAKSAFRLNFKDGYDLTHAGGNHDSTTVALEVLNTVQTAIQAAQTVGSAGIKARAKALGGGGGDGAKLVLDQKLVWTLVETTSIRPGLYRLNKPWEDDGGPQPTGCGLLAQLGLPLVCDVALVKPD